MDWLDRTGDVVTAPLKRSGSRLSFEMSVPGLNIVEGGGFYLSSLQLDFFSTVFSHPPLSISASRGCSAGLSAVQDFSSSHNWQVRAHFVCEGRRGTGGMGGWGGTGEQASVGKNR